MATPDFCTCGNTNCRFHPSRHEEGCTLCVQKNLRRREIPSCFFTVLDGKVQRENFTFVDFAALVLAQKETGEKAMPLSRGDGV